MELIPLIFLYFAFKNDDIKEEKKNKNDLNDQF